MSRGPTSAALAGLASDLGWWLLLIGTLVTASVPWFSEPGVCAEMHPPVINANVIEYSDVCSYPDLSGGFAFVGLAVMVLASITEAVVSRRLAIGLVFLTASVLAWLMLASVVPFGFWDESPSGDGLFMIVLGAVAVREIATRVARTAVRRGTGGPIGHTAWINAEAIPRREQIARIASDVGWWVFLITALATATIPWAGSDWGRGFELVLWADSPPVRYGEWVRLSALEWVLSIPFLMLAVAVLGALAVAIPRRRRGYPWTVWLLPIAPIIGWLILGSLYFGGERGEVPGGASAILLVLLAVIVRELGTRVALGDFRSDRPAVSRAAVPT